MARLTYKAGTMNADCNGPTALGKLFVSYWESARGKDPAEIERLTATLKSDLAQLFEETSSGEVELQLVPDTGSVVHIPIPVPADDLSKYKSDGFAEAFGHAIIMGCGRSPKLNMETNNAPKTAGVSEAPASVKAA